MQCTESIQSEHRHHPPATRLAVRRDYVHGNGTLRKLSECHQVPFLTVRGWARSGRWGKHRKEFLTDAEASQTPPQATTTDTPKPEITLTHASEKVAVIEAQLKRVDELIEDTDDPKGLDSLTRAKDRLLQGWFALTGTPKPANYRTKAPGPSRRQIVVPVDE